MNDDGKIGTVYESVYLRVTNKRDGGKLSNEKYIRINSKGEFFTVNVCNNTIKVHTSLGGLPVGLVVPSSKAEYEQKHAQVLAHLATLK